MECRRILAAAVILLCVVNSVVAQRDAEQIMTDFAGQGSLKNLQAAHRDLKSEVLLSSLKDGKGKLIDTKTGTIAEGFEAIKKIDPQDVASDALDLKHGLAESKYDKSKKLISKVLNLLGIPVSDDPLQDVLDAGIVATAGTTVIAADLSQVSTTNLDRILSGHKALKDAYLESKAETQKALLRNILLIRDGLKVLSVEKDEIKDEFCDSAEFTPPKRKAAQYRGPGLKLTFSAGECALDYENEFLDWEFNIYCNKPSLTYVKTPPMFISEHTTPAMFKTRECKEDKCDFGSVEAILHTFDGSSLLNPSALNNAFFSNIFPPNSRILSGSFDGLATNNTITDLFGSLLDWDLTPFDLKEKKPWDLLSFGSEKSLIGAAADIKGYFTEKLSDVPDLIKKGPILS